MRLFLCLVVGLVLCWGSGGCSDGLGSGPVQDNIILVIIDTCRRDSLSCYGCPRPTTPNLDALAEDGVRFANAISHSPWTLPSIATILTGQYAMVHGAWGEPKTYRCYALRDDINTAPELLAEAGWSTHGLVNAIWLHGDFDLDRGFVNFSYHGAQADRIRRADETISEAIEQLRKHRSRKNFMMIHLYDPHLSYYPPESMAPKFRQGYRGPLTVPVRPKDMNNLKEARHDVEGRRFARLVYDEEVFVVDEQLGILFSALKKMGMYERCTIVVTSDHGEEFWEHDSFGHGRTLYAEQLDVPLIIKPPVDFARARPVIPERVRLIDVMPTIMDFATVPITKSVSGESLIALMTSAERTADRDAYSEQAHSDPDKLSLMSGQYKAIVFPPDNRVELYDTSLDPSDSRDLSAERGDVAQELVQRIQQTDHQLRAQASRLPRRLVNLSRQREQTLRDLGYAR